MKPRLCDGERERRRQMGAAMRDERRLYEPPARSVRVQSAIWFIAGLLAWVLFLAVVCGALIEWPS